MNKTMYIPKGQECAFDNLTCERIIVKGSLRVTGSLKAKHIYGKGFISAEFVSAESITADTLEATTLVVDRLAAARVFCFKIFGTESIMISSMIDAVNVKARKVTYAKAEIKNLEAEEVVVLQPKCRSMLRMLFSSFVRSKWAALRNKYTEKPAEAEDNTAGEDYSDAYACPQAGQQTAPNDAQAQSSAALDEAAKLLSDPEFLRMRAMFKVTRETGDIWQLVPKSEATDRAVTMFQPVAAA